MKEKNRADESTKAASEQANGKGCGQVASGMREAGITTETEREARMESQCCLTLSRNKRTNQTRPFEKSWSMS